jgi:hypothetical protein
MIFIFSNGNERGMDKAYNLIKAPGFALVKTLPLSS